MNDEFDIGLSGQFGRGTIRSGDVPFGRGFAGAAKRIEGVKSDIADFLFEFEGASQVVASLHDGVVSLTGHVQNAADRLLIEESIRKIPGVTDVRMALQIGTAAENLDSPPRDGSKVDSSPSRDADDPL